MLPLPFTLPMLVQQRLLRAWSPSGARQMERCFYFTHKWQQARESLLGPQNREVRWWDIDGEEETVDPSPLHPYAFVEPTMDPSPRGRLDFLVEDFVGGKRRNLLVRPVGAGMNPPFKRMEFRNGIDLSPVVEMRT